MSLEGIILLGTGALGLLVLLVAAWVMQRIRERKNLHKEIVTSLKEIYAFDESKALIDTEMGHLILPGAFGELKFNIEKAPNGKWRIYMDTSNFGQHVLFAPEHFARQLAVAEELEGFYTPEWEKAEVPLFTPLTAAS